jgi:flagellar motor switch protein FliM
LPHPEKTLEKLLHKIDEDQENTTAREAEFKKQLKELLKRHGVQIEAFEAEVLNLHRQG